MITPAAQALVRWERLHQPGAIRVALLDIDGCVTAGETATLDLGVLARLQELNDEATRDPAIPALTLCTGRQLPYVELMMQAIGGFLPAIWENGAGLYLPASYEFLVHPLLDQRRLDSFEAVRGLVQSSLVAPGLARIQPGKMLSISLYPTGQTSLERVSAGARSAIEPYSADYWIQTGVSCVEVLPVDIHKGSGVRWLLDRLSLQPAQTLGIGDAPGDREIFRVTGLSGAPANAAPETLAAASYVSTMENGKAVIDILEWCIGANREKISAGSA